MAELNEEGLEAAQTVSSYPNSTTQDVIEAYFENAKVDTKRRLHPVDRDAHLEGHTLKFVVGGVEGYLTMNAFPDGQLGEVFIHGVGKQGSTVTGLMDLVAILISVALQYGVPLLQITKFMKGMKFEPRDEYYDSIPDYIGNYLEDRYAPH